MNRNYRIVLLTVLGAVLALATLTGAGRLLADVLATHYAPEQVNYQGYLTDSGGNPISSTVTLQFRIYDASSGGNQVWSETHSNVPVTSGYFSVFLGSQSSPLTSSLFKGSPRYLEVEYNGTTFPRQAFGSVPYALVANYATEAMTATYALNGPSGSGADWENVVIVAKSGGDYTSINAALTAISLTVSSSSRYLVLVMPGVYTETVTLPQYVHLKGVSPAITRIASTANNGNFNDPSAATLIVPANSQVSDISVVNASTTNNGVALRVINGNDNTTINNVRAWTTGLGGGTHIALHLSGTPRLTHVYAEASGATNFNWGIFNNAADFVMRNSTIEASGAAGANQAAGLRLNGGDPIIRESSLSGTNGTNGKGIDSSGGGSTVKIDRSSVVGDAGTGSSILSNDINDDFFVGASMLAGDVDVLGTSDIFCAQSYNGSYQDLISTCAVAP